MVQECSLPLLSQRCSSGSKTTSQSSTGVVKNKLLQLPSHNTPYATTKNNTYCKWKSILKYISMKPASNISPIATFYTKFIIYPAYNSMPTNRGNSLFYLHYPINNNNKYIFNNIIIHSSLLESLSSLASADGTNYINPTNNQCQVVLVYSDV